MMLLTKMLNQRTTPFALAAAVFAVSCFQLDAKAQDKHAPERIRIAVFDLEAIDIPDLKGTTLTDQVVTVLSTIEGVQLINREDLSKVAEEQAIGLSGLVDSGSAVRLGRFVNANYILVGRANKIGPSLYVVLKLISVETTVQTTVAVKTPAANGASAALERVEKQLEEKIAALQSAPEDAGAKVVEQLRAKLKPLAKSTFVVQVSEEHVDRPLRDTAAQMAITHRLQTLGLTVVDPKEPVAGWKQHLLETGKYGDRKIDYLIEGEGVSGQGVVLHGLTSCRARVELRIVQVPGRTVTATDRGVGAAVDLVEALAAKQALEDAGQHALDATLNRLLSDNASAKAASRK